ncbi:SDR family oxidoreductase [Mesorhizobium sp.]|uniref:SDR family NAD(P)-dependent oxidoreductase n=1 Tax=Mesorhizobium sp. TaxID=1871066 RepID=UPI000FE79CE3|nr:SDR family oxidoreductase [Mesorhizobium sp.]RWB65973.1 MAG: SDR family oxidoreductase [Mesorhizobium sp.]RWF26083.1 MAG: SDR family oxidoreductase [Mesorhizobium sp.]TIT13552.1 MAG: SDR family oxidoreductase [Mesorhizobium sp.]TIV82841.1 MAG: SDR family oxidoreductase [Mesorhizobium sp.]TIV99298.1 MAG: SDR family oxidoreductase [Mesorhizobium sp.]
MDYLKKFDLSGKRAIVTGSGRGIGLEIAHALGQAGAAIVVADLDADSAAAAAAKLASCGVAAAHRAIDVAKPDAVTALADELNAEQPVDVLINNAGVARIAEALDTSDADWLATMRVNSDAAFWCARAFGRYMIARRAGNIVNIGSMCGMIVTQPQNNTAYITSKGAIHMMTKSLACAWARYNVRVNAVAPGYVATEMTVSPKDEKSFQYDRWLEQTPLGRMGESHEVASAVLFLASPASSYCTGTILSVDGGYTCM